MGSVLVTGATGFVGQFLIRQLDSELIPAIGLGRSATPTWLPASVRYHRVKDIGDGDGLSTLLSDVDCIVHLAARVHVMRDQLANPLDEYRRVNVEGTRTLATAAIAAGVQRFVFVSSIKVNGESTVDGLPFSRHDQPAPCDPYGLSKWEAEQLLQAMANESGLEVVTIRPPMVYGAGVSGNFRRLAKLVASGVPLPFGLVKNQRSLIAVQNLVDILLRCTRDDRAVGQTLLVSDDDDVSTAQLVRLMAEAQGRELRLFPVPTSLMRVGASLIGKSAIVQRLTESLQVDISHTKRQLDWIPPVSVADGIRNAVTA